MMRDGNLASFWGWRRNFVGLMVEMGGGIFTNFWRILLGIFLKIIFMNGILRYI